jgi:hypothetical protein
MSLKIKNKYIEMNNFFNKKLLMRFPIETVDFLIKELETCHNLNVEESINAGHLTSYINMRTGKNFRNRSFYKLLKRVNGMQMVSEIDKAKILKCFSKSQL